MDDLISRQDAIDAIDHYIGEVKNIPKGTAFKEGVKDGYCRIRSIIMSLPSTLDNVHGKWIYKNDNVLIPTGYWECSVCKEGRLMYEQNFCPNCGARMDLREVKA